MTHYSGDRTIDGIIVEADGVPLDPREDLRVYSATGFEWAYEGDEARQLALAILAHHLGDGQRALALVEPFMTAVVANMDNTWEMATADVQAAIDALTRA